MIVGQLAHLLQVLQQGQFGTHLHLRSHDLLHIIGGFVEFQAELGYLGVSEEILEIIDGGLGVAKEFDLLFLLKVEVFDGMEFFEVTHGLRVHMLAEVLRLETLALFGSRPLVEYLRRSLKDHPTVPRLCTATHLKIVLSAFREELLLELAPSAVGLFLLRGGEFYLRGNRFHRVAQIFLLVQPYASGDGLDGIWLDGVGGGGAERLHFFGYFDGVMGEVDLVALVVTIVEPVVVGSLVVAHGLVLVSVEVHLCHLFNLYLLLSIHHNGRKGMRRGYIFSFGVRMVRGDGEGKECWGI
jgi:hypothetical protein